MYTYTRTYSYPCVHIHIPVYMHQGNNMHIHANSTHTHNNMRMHLSGERNCSLSPLTGGSSRQREQNCASQRATQHCVHGVGITSAAVRLRSIASADGMFWWRNEPCSPVGTFTKVFLEYECVLIWNTFMVCGTKCFLLAFLTIVIIFYPVGWKVGCLIINFSISHRWRDLSHRG